MWLYTHSSVSLTNIPGIREQACEKKYEGRLVETEEKISFSRLVRSAVELLDWIAWIFQKHRA